MLSTQDKKSTLRRLGMGDVVLCTDGKEYEFIRMKQTKFIGRNNNGNYDIPVQMFVEVVKKNEKERFDVSKLNQGELFYILNSKQEPVVFRFKYMINVDKVQAENPANEQPYRIPASLIEGSAREWMS